MAAPAKAVLCVGRLYCDLVFTGLDGPPAPGRERYAEGLAVMPGGGAWITAAYLAAFGRPAALAARIGRDPWSAGLQRALVGAGVDLRWLDRTEDDEPQLTVALSMGGERAFVTRRVGGAEPATLDAALAAAGLAHVHIAELATLREIPGLPARARAHGLTVSLDCSWDEAAIRDPAALDRLEGVDVFLPNLAEALALAGRDPAEADAIDRLDAPALEAAADLLTSHAPVVAIKCGALGGLLRSRRQQWTRIAPRVPVVDTTGAGDAFNAGFLDAWLDDAEPADALARAVAGGSLAIGVRGGRVAPDAARLGRGAANRPDAESATAAAAVGGHEPSGA